ncbi:MarR family transcriptional regulator [Reichenbachiella carrageenanivorans]|uniref:MarR family transcriptional regulator n=1 Tax=Reichenbachiella carrageenanivorans TaxID=2979869 RepID=A0ABY6D3E7_9BACT|nr:MarR family transcriptional regulator [Reichenbachiella carrageenanivorans]UXX80424.1 MarR family transcriptional regulator [Reichenbachiella carrageenanivorans]
MRKEETVDYHIKVVWHAISRMYNQGGSMKGITASSGFVLLNIDQDEGTPATKIAPLLGMESRSLTRMLKNMEETGLIYRERDTEDKRSVRIYLTEAGKKQREFSRKAVIFFNDKVRESVSPKKLEAFFEVMTAIDNVIEENKNLDQKIQLIENE